MVMRLVQEQKISQRIIITSQLKMAISLLKLSRVELIDRINYEIEKNPLLEEVEIKSDYYDPETISEINNWESYLDYYDKNRFVVSSPVDIDNENIKFQDGVYLESSLTNHLLWQLLLSPLSEEEKNIGSFIIGNLTRDGYLKLSVLDIVNETGFDINLVKKVIKIIQSLEPAGVCSRNLKECLLLQANRFGLNTDLIVEIISNNFLVLKKKNYRLLSRSLKVEIEDIYNAVKIITSFDPRPGRRFSSELTEYIEPDIYIYENNGEFLIKLNDTGLPKLRISSEYNKDMSYYNLDKSAKYYFKNKKNSAFWLIKSLYQRHETIYKVMESILRLQRNFFYKGINYLRPMVLKEVAEDIGMHESTVSRVTNNKYVSTNQGLFKLNFFFTSSIKCLNGNNIASTIVQEKIKKIIGNENSLKPFADRKISELLKIENINIARRTVAKYRKIMGIMPSNMRK